MTHHETVTDQEKTLSKQAMQKALSTRDLTNPTQGQHCMQRLIDEIQDSLYQHWQCPQLLLRPSPVVSVKDNYDRLCYPSDGAARDARYTRYLSETHILRTQTSAAIPDLLAGLAAYPPHDLTLLTTGLVYRRDSIDRLHCGEPHQLDIWRLLNNHHQILGTRALQEMITIVMRAAIPGIEWQTTVSPHPYTEAGVQIDAWWQDQWIEVGECGLIADKLLQQTGQSQSNGLAMGLGLDRLLMIRKNIPDIRLLRSDDARVQQQMNDLAPYQPVSLMPAITRDISLCIHQHTDCEQLGDKIRESMSDQMIESLIIVSETPYEQLPAAAHRRMGMAKHQKNVLLRIMIRALDKTLTDQEANEIRNQVYRLLHEGNQKEIAENKSD
ncbi:MAG: hypothetical protein MI976_13165 [Pseudomonadales bacterium]|nr:hypothetical protein [Pseudomonadales bacterium]